MFAKSISHPDQSKAPREILARTKVSLCFFICVFLSLNLSLAAFATEKYIFILPSLSNPYWQTMRKGVEDAGKESNVTLTVLSAVSDQGKEEFLNLFQSAVSQNPAIIVVCTTTDSVTFQCLREAQNHRIKVAVLNTAIPDAVLRKAGINLSFSIGTDNVMIGERAAQFVARQSKSRSPKVLVLEGVIGSTNSANRVAGFNRELVKELPGAKIINSVSAEWDRLKALNITVDTLTRTPDLSVVFAANDMMALGAAEAVRLAGKSKEILIVGVDGVPDARKAILAGRITASVAQLPYLIGRRSVELAKQSVQGQCSGKSERTPLLVLTKSVLESNSDPLLKYVR